MKFGFDSEARAARSIFKKFVVFERNQKPNKPRPLINTVGKTAFTHFILVG